MLAIKILYAILSCYRSPSLARPSPGDCWWGYIFVYVVKFIPCYEHPGVLLTLMSDEKLYIVNKESRKLYRVGDSKRDWLERILLLLLKLELFLFFRFFCEQLVGKLWSFHNLRNIPVADSP